MKRTFAFGLSLLMLVTLCFSACAEGEKVGVAYGVYCQEGESPDSAIAVDEALIPISGGGAEGWAIISEEQATELGNAAAVTVGDAFYCTTFRLGDMLWQGVVDEAGALTYTSTVDGAEVAFNDYIATPEGGEWYYAHYEEGATLVDSAGNDALVLEIGTKASINHGVDFWPSDITFPGNIQRIEDYVMANGVNYGFYPESTDIAKGEDGAWRVLDTTTGATLAGTPNYLNLIKEAYEGAE